MKPEELREMTGEELSSKGKTLQDELFNLKIQSSTGKLENPMRLRMLRRDVARIKTIFKEKSAKQGSSLEKAVE